MKKKDYPEERPKPKPKMKATERKKLIRERIRNNFSTAGCELLDLKAGPQHYTAVRAPSEDFNIAAIYGSRIGASIWIKEEVHERLRVKHPEEFKLFADIVDVDLFRRGFAWAIHFRHPVQDAELIDLVCEISLAWGNRERNRRLKVEETRAKEAEDKIQRELDRKERMNAKRSEWRHRHEVEPEMGK